jgi:hypothetical protein
MRFVKALIKGIYITNHVTMNSGCSEEEGQVIERMEPTSGLEPLTCRLRIIVWFHTFKC